MEIDEDVIAAVGGDRWGRGQKVTYGLLNKQLRKSFEQEDGSFDKEGYTDASRHMRDLGPAGYMREQADKANDLLQQAEDAARAGDMDLANDLRAQGMALNDDMAIGNDQKGSFLKGSMSLGEITQEQKLQSAMGGPMGQTAGMVVKEGREILDRDSETSRAMRKSLTEGSERAIAAGSRQSQRQSRNQRAGAGGARMMGAERAFADQQSNSAAFALAQVHTQAAATYESQRTELAKNSVKFGMDFISNAAGVRDQFTQSMNAVRGLDVNQANAAAGRQVQWGEQGMQAQAKKDAKKAAVQGKITGAVMAVAGAALMFTPLAPLGAAMMAGGIKQMAGGDGGGAPAAPAGGGQQPSANDMSTDWNVDSPGGMSDKELYSIPDPQ
jgi:hypothetical protein